MRSNLPIRDSNSILEELSELYFKQNLPAGWLTDKPRDFGIDLNIGIVHKNQVTGLNFSSQLKATKKLKSAPVIGLKTSTINYLLNRLEPVMLLLYVQEKNQAYWKWLKKEDFDFSKNQARYTIHFDLEQRLDNLDWNQLFLYVQRVFKVQKQLLTSLEYDLFSHSELEAKAWAHYFNRNLQEAAFYFKRVLENEVKALTLLALAQCEYSLYDYNNALMHINNALELEQSSNLLQTKGIILAEDGIQNKDFYKLKQAESIFEKLYNEDPNAIHSYNYANTSASLNQLDRAEELYTKAVKLRPDYAEAWKNLGQLYYDLGKHKKEMRCYEKALKINPALPEARISKGITLTSIYGKHDEAIKEMTAGIELDPKIFIRFPLIYYWMSRAHFENNNIIEALDWANKGLNHYPGHYNIREVKAKILVTNLDNPNVINEAVAFFEEGRRLHPKDSLNFYYWCASNLKIGQQDKILLELTGWIENNLRLKVTSGLISKFPLEDLMKILEHWDNTATYFETFDEGDFTKRLNELENVETFLNHFKIARAIFISLLDIELNYKKTTREFVDKCIKDALYPLPVDLLANMVTATKENPDRLAAQISTVVVNVSTLYLIEICRCVGFLAGKSRKYNRKVQDLLDGEKLHKDLMLATTEMLYKLPELNP